MHVVICEDDARLQLLLRDHIDRWSEQFNCTDYKVSVFTSSEDLYEKWLEGFRAHLIFLDIEFPNEMSGMDLATMICRTAPDTAIVFTTNFEEYVYQGYTCNALRYLKKPLRKEDIFECMSIVYKQYNLLCQDRSVLELPGEKIVLRYAEILYIEAQSPNLDIHVQDHQSPLSIRCRLTKIDEQLPRPLFAFCHRSYIVNVSQIRRLKKSQLMLSDGTYLPVSEKHAAELYHCFEQYHQEGGMI